MFRRDGDRWTAAFSGRTVTLRDAKGLRDLAVLLAAPGREVPATELVALQARVAAQDGAIVPVIVPIAPLSYPAWRLFAERAISTNTAAAGGNAALMTLDEPD